MKIILLVVVIIVLLIIFLLIKVKLGSLKTGWQMTKKLEPIRTALKNDQELDKNLIETLASDPLTRNSLYDELEKFNKSEFFPAKYRTKKYFAESDLVFWLNHPNELRQPPDEIELTEIITLNSDTEPQKLEYYLFRFCTKLPHWASQNGWMAGVSGPYLTSENAPLISPPGTFSELEKYDSKTPQEHVEYFHQRTNVSILKEWKQAIKK
jgi:hypothetical protein